MAPASKRKNQTVGEESSRKKQKFTLALEEQTGAMENKPPFRNFPLELWYLSFKLWDAQTLSALRNTSHRLRELVDKQFRSKVWFSMDWSRDFDAPFVDGENYGFWDSSKPLTYKRCLPTGVSLQERTKVQRLLLRNYPTRADKRGVEFFANLKTFFPNLSCIRLSRTKHSISYKFGEEDPLRVYVERGRGRIERLCWGNVVPIPRLEGCWGQLLRINAARAALEDWVANARRVEEIGRHERLWGMTIRQRHIDMRLRLANQTPQAEFLEKEVVQLEQQLVSHLGHRGGRKWMAFAAEVTREMRSNPLDPFCYDKSVASLGEMVLSRHFAWS